MSNKAGKISKEHGDSEIRPGVGQDPEKQEIAEEIDAQNSERISPASSEYDRTPLSREPSLARTKSKQSNVLAKVTSRLTQRSIKDPGPAPDGGFQAWLQCFCA